MESKPIPIKQIAKDLSISSTTVSRALSGKGRVSEDTRNKIIEYLEELGAQPAVYNREYSHRKTKNILITVAGEKDYGLLPYFSQVIMGAYDYFQPLGYQVILVKTSAGDIEPLKNIIKSHKCDGVILSRTIENALDIKYLQDNGVRKIALFCGDMTHVVTKSRMKGFLQAYEKRQIDFDCTKVFDNTGYAEIAEKQTLKMLKEEIECIICMDDNICINVLNSLRKYKVRIPKDIKIASFYNSQILDEYYPSISCVNLDIMKLAHTASDVLYGLLCGKSREKRIIQGYSILLKESTKV